MALNLITKNALKELHTSKSEFADARREDALEKFNSIPMPKEKDEDWRYTEIEKLKPEHFAPFESNTIITTTDLSEDLARQGVILSDINSAMEKYPATLNYFFKGTEIDKDKFVALSAAHFAHGYFLYIPKNLEIKEPIRIKICEIILLYYNKKAAFVKVAFIWKRKRWPVIEPLFL